MKGKRVAMLPFLLFCSGLCLGWSPFWSPRGERGGGRLWTVMLYMSPEPTKDLEGAIIADLLEMMKVGSSDEVMIVAQVDWQEREKGNAFRYLIYKGRILLEEEWVPREVNIGDPKELEDFIRWATDKFPARNYLLVFSGHGLGWRPRRPIFVPIIKGVMTDLTGDLLENHEVRDAFSQAGVLFNIVAFDSCLMQMMEVCYEIKGFAHFAVGSEEVVPGKGFPYDKILGRLVEEPTISSLELAKAMVDEYLASYTSRELREGGLKDITLSAVHLPRLGELARRAGEIASSLISAFPSFQREILSCIEEAETFSSLEVVAEKDFKDLKHFALLVGGRVKDPQVKGRAQRLVEAFEGAVPYSGYKTGELENAFGLSVYLPNFFTSHEDSRGYTKEEAVEEYGKTLFSQETAWDEFIFLFHPVAIIEEPEEGEAIETGTAEIEGRAFAQEMKEWRLEYGRGRHPRSWSLIAQGERPVFGPLAFWDISKLPDDLYSLRLKVEDQKGREARWMVRVVLNRGGTYPIAKIIEPKEGEDLRGKVAVKGTALSLELRDWRLEYGEGRGAATWSLISEGKQEVREGLLGIWDTTLVPDGLYTLRLKVWNRKGQMSEACITVRVDNTFPSILGTVTDAQTGKPIAGAVVEALGPEGFRALAYTDSQGNYVLRELEPARYTIRAHALGYEQEEQTLQISMKPDEWRVDFSLRKAPPRRPGAISGLVYVSVSREPLGKAEVAVSFGGRVIKTTITSSEALTEAGYKFNYRVEGLQPGIYEVRVSLPGFTPQPEKQTVEVKEGEETRKVNFSMRPFHYIARGLQMISLPYDYSRVAPDPADLLGVAPAALKLAKWEAAWGRYVFYPDPPAERFKIGEGYWLYLDNPVSITVEGISASPAQPYPILLRAGWNMIGAPFTFAVDWYDCEVEAEGERMSIEEATRRGILGSGLWSYEFGSYRLAFTLEPWKGYWVRAFRSCVLLVSNRPISDSRRVAVRALRPGATKEGWALRLCVEAAGTRDDHNLLGLLEGAGEGYDPAVDVLEPPPVGLMPQVRAYFDSPLGPLAVDARGGREACWSLVVEIPQGAKEVKLTFQGLSSLPREVSLTLHDPVAGKRVFLRTSSVYVFKPRGGERVRGLKIRATKAGSRLSIVELRARRLRGGVMLRFLLTSPAEVEAGLFTPSGGEVAKGARLWASPGWNRAFLPTGREVPPGVYLVEVRARGEDGREARATRLILLR